MGRPRQSVRTLMASVHVEPGGCWTWTKRLDKDGYGVASWIHQNRRAHRLVYELLVRPIPDGLQLDHLCRVKSCVNPSHLEPVDCRTNLHRGNTVNAMNAAKTHCQKGHPLEGTNLAIRHHSRKGSYRECRTCKRDYYR